MTYLLTAAQMRAWEQAAITSGEVTGLELMERAGRGAVDAILAEWPDLATGTHPALILCGPGNNGGDGFVVARLLAERGWTVDCLFYGDADKLPPDARANYDRWIAMGNVAPMTVDALQRCVVANVGPDGTGLIVDAVFGTGLSRPVPEDVGLVLSDARYAVPLSFLPFCALDCPSGFCCDSGRWLGDGSRTSVDLCVTFHSPKTGHYLGDLPNVIRKLKAVDIGLSHDAAPKLDFDAVGDLFTRMQEVMASGGNPRSIIDVGAETAAANALAAQDAARVPLVTSVDWEVDKAQTGHSHKFDHGHALVLAGGVGRGGAARLAARAALRIGAGLVTVAPPPAALIENACHLDAIMLQRMPDATALQDILSDERITALCVGPGFGLTEREAAIVATIIRAGKTCVLDADALTLIAGDAEMAKALHPKCVLTPHMGEFARLAPDLAERLKAPAEQGPAYSKLDATRELAARLGCIVLLKGSDTVIADPTGRAAIHAAAYGRQVPWLATAGAGDVLAGIITGLLARGFEPMTACESASWLHVEAARQFGPGLISEDLPEALPAVLRGLQADQDAT